MSQTHDCSEHLKCIRFDVPNIRLCVPITHTYDTYGLFPDKGTTRRFLDGSTVDIVPWPVCHARKQKRNRDGHTQSFDERHVRCRVNRKVVRHFEFDTKCRDVEFDVWPTIPKLGKCHVVCPQKRIDGMFENFLNFVCPDESKRFQKRLYDRSGYITNGNV